MCFPASYSMLANLYFALFASLDISLLGSKICSNSDSGLETRFTHVSVLRTISSFLFLTDVKLFSFPFDCSFLKCVPLTQYDFESLVKRRAGLPSSGRTKQTRC